MTDSYKFEIQKPQRSIIKVIGVGGGGGNAVNHMFQQGIRDVEFVVANTDLQALHNSPVLKKVQLGPSLTEGLGSGANPEVGKNSALESKEQIREMLSGTKMVFITAGMGKGTGTGAAPVIAKIAKEMDILTVGIVTIPFAFEGKKKIEQARLGIENLRASCDTVLIIVNDKLREIFGNLTMQQAFGEANNVLTTAAKGIAEIITLPGYVNVDFQDVRTVMLNAGGAVMGSAETRGDNRAMLAVQQALASPLLDNHDIMDAKKILLSIMSGDQADIQMDELTQITDYIQQQAGDDADMIWGHGIDPTLEDRIRVTIIATGFEQRSSMPSTMPAKKVHELEKPAAPLFEQPDNSVNLPQGEISLSVQRPVEEKKEPIQPEKTTPISTPQKEKQNGSLSIPLQFEFENRNTKPATEWEDFGLGFDPSSDLTTDDEGLMNTRETKRRLEEQQRERREKLRLNRTQDMSSEDFGQRWSLPAYLRRGVSMDNTPHSSEPLISRYQLNEENTIIGNNKFLHDNVD